MHKIELSWVTLYGERKTNVIQIVASFFLILLYIFEGLDGVNNKGYRIMA